MGCHYLFNLKIFKSQITKSTNSKAVAAAVTLDFVELCIYFENLCEIAITQRYAEKTERTTKSANN